MGLRADQKIVVVTRPTQLAALSRQFGTRSQAKFKLVSAKRRQLSQGTPVAAAALEEDAVRLFDSMDKAASLYESSVKTLRSDLDFDDFDLPVQTVDRDFLPNFLFGPNDVVVTVGQDGLVANTAKYAAGLPIIAINPDPSLFDGILLPFRTDQARAAVRSVLQGRAKFRSVTLAQAQLEDGQKLLAFNELFIGCRTHVSARYRLTIDQRSEAQSSSGMIVSTGAGSTGWLSSIFNMSAGVGALMGHAAKAKPVRLPWDDPRLVYVIREPFISKASSANLVAGILEPGKEIIVESEMTGDGVIFSDGVEADFLEFNAGATVRIQPAAIAAKLVVP
jgi:NAD kinase